MMPPKISLLKLTQGKTIKAMYEKYHCIQDMLVPLGTLAESLEYFHTEFQVQHAAAMACNLFICRHAQPTSHFIAILPLVLVKDVRLITNSVSTEIVYRDNPYRWNTELL